MTWPPGKGSTDGGRPQVIAREIPPDVAHALLVTLAAGVKAGTLHGAPWKVTTAVHGVLRELIARSSAPRDISGSGSQRRIDVPPLALSQGEVMSAPEAADALGITPRRVGQLAEEMQVGCKVGGRWIFTPDDVQTMRRRHAA